MIKVYTDITSINKMGDSLMFPLLSEMLVNKNPSFSLYFQFTENANDADIFILPYYYDYLVKKNKLQIYTDLYTHAVLHNKSLWMVIGGDVPLKFNERFVFVFKMTDYKSKLQVRNIVMPVFIGDPLERFFDNNFDQLSKTNSPKIGYVGHAKNGLLKSLRTIYIFLNYNTKVFFGKIVSDYTPLYFSSHIRFNYLKILEKSKLLQCYFIYRDRYRAGAKSKSDIQKTTNEFYRNIKDTQYTFCIRGGGNFSVRLYECMAMGRIPIQIDTDSVLPLQDYLDWNNHILLIPEKEILNAPSKILEFHNSYSDSEFINLQKNIRKFWQENLIREGYFKHIHDLFLEHKL